jgi:CubicO group peptidase (beta-lactamase class C family)
MKKYMFALFLTGITMASSYAQVPGFIADSLDIFVEREMERWNIPGVAVAIVKDGEILVSKGYGVTDLESKTAVNGETLFMVASNSKAFTGTAVALLENEGRMRMNDPVIKYLPWLDLHDDCATEMVTTRDMLTHNIGLQTFQGDFLHWGSNLNRRQLLEKMDVHEPVYDFRSGYGYCNMGFVAAGEVIEAVTDTSWDDFVNARIFMPLGMGRSTTTYAALTSDKNACTGYTIVDGELMLTPYENIDNLGPAASINSCTDDLARWLIMNSQEGSIDGRQLFPEAVIRQATSPYNFVSETRGGLFPARHFELYGLGWFMADYNGKKMVWHDGGANGFVTTTCFLPEIDLGIVVLTNTDANWFYEALKMQLTEAWLDMPYRNISMIYHTYWTQNQDMEKQEKDNLYARARGSAASSALPIKAYTGNYSSPVYGMISIKEEEGKLKVSFSHHPELFGVLEPLGDHQFVCTYNDPIYGVKEVHFDASGEGVTAYHMTVNDFIDRMEYTFNKIIK